MAPMRVPYTPIGFRSFSNHQSEESYWSKARNWNWQVLKTSYHDVFRIWRHNRLEEVLFLSIRIRWEAQEYIIKPFPLNRRANIINTCTYNYNDTNLLSPLIRVIIVSTWIETFSTIFHFCVQVKLKYRPLINWTENNLVIRIYYNWYELRSIYSCLKI